MRDEPARVWVGPAARENSLEKKYSANVECGRDPGDAPAVGKRATERDPIRADAVRPACRVHDSRRTRLVRAVRTPARPRPTVDAFRRASRGTKTTLRGLKNECSRVETPRRKRSRAPRRTDVSPKKTNGTVNAPVHNSNRVRKRQMRRAVARRASLSNARRLAAFPAPLEKKRRKQTPGPTPVSRAAATSHARAHPFTALRDLNKTQEMPTG